MNGGYGQSVLQPPVTPVHVASPMTPTTPVPMEVGSSSCGSPATMAVQGDGSSCQLVSSIQETRTEFSFHQTTQEYLDNIKEMVHFFIENKEISMT